MKIQFKQSVFTGGRCYAADEVAELSPEYAAHVLKQGFAVAVKDEPKLETTDKPTEAKPADLPPVVSTATIQPAVTEIASKRKVK